MRTQVKAMCLVLIVALAAGFSPVLAGELVNMEFSQAPLVDVFQILGQLGGYNVLVDPSVQGEVSFVLKDLSFEEALDLVTKTTGYGYTFVGNTLVVGSDQRLKTEFGTQDVSFVPVKHVDVEAAQRLVTLVVPNVRSYVDRELNLLVLYGLTSDLDMAKRVLAEYDVQGARSVPTVSDSLKPAAAEAAPTEELTYRAISISYGDGMEILAVVQRLLPHRELSFDAGSRLLMGSTTAEEWNDIKLMVEELDLPKFELKGVLRSEDQAVFLVEHDGKTYSVKLGDILQGWEITASGEGEVEFTRGQRSFTVRIGR
jgi:hypothetical protein